MPSQDRGSTPLTSTFFQAVFFAMDQKPGVVSMLLLSGLIAFLPLLKTGSFWELLTKRMLSSADSSVFLTIGREMLRELFPIGISSITKGYIFIS